MPGIVVYNNNYKLISCILKIYEVKYIFSWFSPNIALTVPY